MKKLAQFFLLALAGLTLSACAAPAANTTPKLAIIIGRRIVPSVSLNNLAATVGLAPPRVSLIRGHDLSFIRSPVGVMKKAAGVTPGGLIFSA